jgi:tRNA(Ile)-lysidine synthase
MQLTAESFAALMAPFAPFESRPVLAVAVSGGRDSLALALLARDWATARGGHVTALIVDHGLRAEAAVEAAATRDLLSGHGIAADILQWTGAKPAHGLQEAARGARYGLLFEACRERSVLHLLVAHHADDQAETVAMRAARGSGPDGLAGMAALVERRHARLLRPLLSVPRADLTATLEARGVAWIDDPSNTDRRFERARLRAAGVARPADLVGPARERSIRERRLAQAAVDTIEVDGAVGGEVDGEADGEMALDKAAFGRLGAGLGAGLLSRLVQAVAGRDHPPRRDRLHRAVERLCGAVARGKSGKSQDFTLSECRLMLRQAPPRRRLRWIVRHENGRRNGRKEGQPLVPAAFFACDALLPPHVD